MIRHGDLIPDLRINLDACLKINIVNIVFVVGNLSRKARIGYQ